MEDVKKSRASRESRRQSDVTEPLLAGLSKIYEFTYEEMISN